MAGETCSIGKKHSSKCPSFDLRNLYIKGIWDGCTQADLDDIFKSHGVICQSRVHGDGIGFIRFEKKEEAASALSLNGTKPDVRCTQPLVVKNANKKTKRPKSILKNPNGENVAMNVHENTKNIYLRGLPRSYKKDQIIDLCSQFGTITSIRICKKNISFVRFLRDQDASNAVRNLHGKLLPNCTVPILAKLANSDPFEPRIEFSSISSKNKCIRNNATSTERTSKLQQYPIPQNESKDADEIVHNELSNNSIPGDIMDYSRINSNSFILPCNSQISQSPCTRSNILNISLNPLTLNDNNSITSTVCPTSSRSLSSNPSPNLSSPLHVGQQSFQQSSFSFNECYSPFNATSLSDLTNSNKDIFKYQINSGYLRSVSSISQSPIESKNFIYFSFTSPATNTANVFPFTRNNIITSNSQNNYFPVTNYFAYPGYLGFKLL